jgi:hypothetical protein
MQILRVLVSCFLLLWLILTLIFNIPKLDILISRYLPTGRWTILIPSWSFFAPNPAKSDHALLYRDLYDSGEISPWREVISSQLRHLRTSVWNPDGRPKKALSDATSSLMRLARRHNGADTSMVLSVPYLLLLNRISCIPSGPGVTNRQFLIVRYSVKQPQPEVVLLSNMHEI